MSRSDRDRASSEQRECRICSALRIVPVLDKRIERSPRAGNKYRTFCFGCSSWGPMTSEDHFRASLHPHVLPADGDPNEPDRDLVPLTDYDYADEWADLRERVTVDRANRARADGGRPLDDLSDSPEPDDAHDLDATAADPAHPPTADESVDDEENEFDCPGCGEHVAGFPESCPNCGADYAW